MHGVLFDGGGVAAGDLEGEEVAGVAGGAVAAGDEGGGAGLVDGEVLGGGGGFGFGGGDEAEVIPVWAVVWEEAAELGGETAHAVAEGFFCGEVIGGGFDAGGYFGGEVLEGIAEGGEGGGAGGDGEVFGWDFVLGVGGEPGDELIEEFFTVVDGGGGLGGAGGPTGVLPSAVGGAAEVFFEHALGGGDEGFGVGVGGFPLGGDEVLGGVGGGVGGFCGACSGEKWGERGLGPLEDFEAGALVVEAVDHVFGEVEKGGVGGGKLVGSHGVNR